MIRNGTTCTSDDQSLLAGARNCVLDCAQVTKGSNVTIINEIGSVEEAVALAIEHVARDAGARVDVIWAPPVDKTARDAKIPDAVLRALRDAEIVISHYDSASRSALQEYFPAEKRVRVPNRANTVALLGSPWARFPYGLQRVISDVLEARMQPGLAWHITGPAGTDLRGRFIDADSDVAVAFFQTDEDNNRARRNFPGGVHPPRISAGTEGVLAAEYVDGAPFEPGDVVRLRISDGQVTGVDGGDSAGKARQRVAESDGYFDSWHTGVNPKTVVPVRRSTNPRKWYAHTHCSPHMVHFHLGRGHDTINVGVLRPTLEIDGVTIFEAGELRIGNDPAIAAALASYALNTNVLITDPILV